MRRVGPALGLAWCVALAATLTAREARAQETSANPLAQVGIEPAPPDLGTVKFRLVLIGSALSVLPGGFGADVAVGARVTDGPRFLLTWPFQIPIRPSNYTSHSATFTNHRFLLEPGLAFGAQNAFGFTSAKPATFRTRIGYRFVVHSPGHAIGLITGFGSTTEFWPIVRPSISPEVGLHIGRCCGEPTVLFTFVLRTDVWFTGNNDVRFSALMGWAFY